MPPHARLRAIVVGFALAGGLVGLAWLHPATLPHRLVRGAARRHPPEGARWLEPGDMVWQRDLHDCGPASLANFLIGLADRSGTAPPPLDSLASLVHLTARGTRFGDLAHAAGTLGVPARLIRIRMPGDPLPLRRIPLPAIAWVERSHFVTIASLTTSDSVEVIDPLRGRLLWSWEGFRRVWEGHLLVQVHPPSPSMELRRTTPHSTPIWSPT